MNGHRTGGKTAPVACHSHSEGQVEVLVIEKDALVESPDLFKRIAVKQRGTAGGTQRIQRGIKPFDWFAGQIVPGGQGSVAADSGRIDQAGIACLQKDSSNHCGTALILSFEEPFDEAIGRYCVIVQKDDWTLAVEHHGTVQGRSEAKVLTAEGDPLHSWKVPGQHFGAARSLTVVSDYYLHLDRLRLQCFKAGCESIASLEGGYVHGRGGCAHTGYS